MQNSFRSSRQKKPLMAEINVVPYIDVTLVLLIVFMITAPMVQQAITVNLPQAPAIIQSDQITPTETPFVITVTRDGLYKTSANPDIYLSQKDLENLIAETLARALLNPATPIFIQGDRQAAYGKVVNLFVLLKANGVEKVSLLTEPEPEAF